MDNAAIEKNIVSNFLDFIQTAVNLSPHSDAESKDLQGSFQYFTGCDSFLFNGVFNNYQHQQSGIKDDFLSLTDFFLTKKKPFIWWWIEQRELPSEIKQELDKKNFQFLGDFLGIAAKLSEIKLHMNEDKNLEIRTVTHHDEFVAFIEIVHSVFQLPESMKKDLHAIYQSYGPESPLKHYLGFYNGEPVATLSNHINGNVVGIYNVATLSKVRKQGICSSLTAHALKEAIQGGSQYAVAQLMSSAMAKNIALEIGFKQYSRWLPYVFNPTV